MTADNPTSSSTRGESPQMSQISPSSSSPTAASPASSAANSVTTTLDKCRAACWIVFQLAGQHREIAGRQRPFAEHLPEEIRDAEGEQEGVGNPFARHSKQRTRRHFAEQTQQTRRQRAQTGDNRSGNQGVSSCSAHCSQW